MMNVLVVDDDPTMALLIAATLRALAKRIEVTSTFAEAKLWLKRCGFDVVLLDIGLPDSFAEDTVTRVSEMKETGAKVVIITAAWPPWTTVTPESSGADDVIYKGDADMLEKLKGLVGSSRPA